MLFIIAILVSLAGFFVFFTFKPKLHRDASTRVGALVIAFISLVLALAQCITVIPAGHVGVVDFFGHVSDNTLKPGINLVNPLARVVKMSIKTREMKEIANVPSKEGLIVNLEVSVLFHLNPEKANEVYKTIGTNYEDIILRPQFRSIIRSVTAGYEAKALYTSEREKLADNIKVELESLVAPRGIIIESTPLRNIKLPERLAEAIEEKLKAEQESQRMQFVLEKEKLEAERKRIEAKGISDFQQIVTKGISDQLLRWKGIEATEKLANSPNAKIVIIGGKDGLPLIMNTK
jgi:regulator of protease activity HflC (stomatin/prohibitin superfamily)